MKTYHDIVGDGGSDVVGQVQELRQGIEQYAKSASHREIDEEVLEQARGQFGM